ncbi:MAG: hypothetical protein PHN63_05095, partial [Candidatus Omnitrophica bacterium]|nr:hypothetical protein [Candidatus Omnitrophota bacterium]
MVKKRAKVKSKKAKAKKIVKSPKAKVKKTAKRRSSAKKAKARAKKPISPEASLEKIGEITHYFPHVNAAAVKLLKSGLRV